MKVFFQETGKQTLEVSEDIFTFRCSQPVTIQPGELKKVPLGGRIKVEKGYVLNLYTPVELRNKALALFPAVLVIDQAAPDLPLEVVISNAGRNPTHLMFGEIVARGYVSRTESVELEAFAATDPADEPKSSRPQKRNTEIKFEVR